MRVGVVVGRRGDDRLGRGNSLLSEGRSMVSLRCGNGGGRRISWGSGGGTGMQSRSMVVGRQGSGRRDNGNINRRECRGQMGLRSNSGRGRSTGGRCGGSGILAPRGLAAAFDVSIGKLLLLACPGIIGGP